MREATTSSAFGVAHELELVQKGATSTAMVVPCLKVRTDGNSHVEEGTIKGPLGDVFWHVWPACLGVVVHEVLNLTD